MTLPLAAMASIMFISRLLDGVSDIFIGFMVDKTKSKYGKARPWLLWMALPGLISMSALFYVPSLSERGLIIYAFITYNCVAFFVTTAMTLPLQSLLSLMITNDPKRRVTMNMLGMGVCTAFVVLGNTEALYRSKFLPSAILGMIVLSLLLAWHLRRRKKTNL